MFKCCPNCGVNWQERDDFLEDPDLRVIGYQVNFKALKAGIFLFNHRCRGTLAIHAVDFCDMDRGPMFKERLTGSDACPGHCLHEDNLGECPARCECSFVRRILKTIRSWPKRHRQTASGLS